MAHRLIGAWRRLSLAQRFLLGTLLIMLAGMFGVSNWVGRQIEAGVVRQSGATAALLLESFVAPQLQDYAKSGQLSARQEQALAGLLAGTPVGKWVVAFTVWDMHGREVYSSDPGIVKVPGPTAAELLSLAAGEVSSSIDRLEKDTDSPLRKYSDRLVKTSSPIREYNSGRIFAVIQFYQDVDTMQAEIDTAQRRSGYVVGAFMLGMYVLLAIFSRQSSVTIERQQQELRARVTQLTELLTQNRQLHERVRAAAERVAGLHEALLRRIGSELHDGPAQELGLALMQLDMAIAQREGDPRDEEGIRLLGKIQAALHSAMTEMRAIAAGLALPQLAGLTPAQVIEHATRAHERRTNTHVELELDSLPAELPMPVKITVYRLVQEALTNSFKHAGGAGQRVCGRGFEHTVSLEISDQGPGFDAQQALRQGGDHLGLAGMRERVESLGGTFEVQSEAGRGTTVSVSLGIPGAGGNHG